MERFNYGDVVRDKVTGFQGKVTGIVDYFGYRPKQYRVETLNAGLPITLTIDENRAEAVRNCKCSASGAVYIHEAS